MSALNLFTNNASTTLASSIDSSVTSLTVASGTGGLFPNPAGSQYFYCTLSNTAGTIIEIVKVTSRSTDTFTIVRGQDNTSAASFSAGDKVELRLTAADLQNFPQLDSTNTFALAQTFTNGVSLGVDLPVTDGGTGGSDGATARLNLDAAKSGANSDITSLTGLTTALSVAQGGTGVTTSTGTGPGVHQTNAYLITPDLDTPSQIDLTNATLVPMGQATGTLATNHGGTGLTSIGTSGQMLAVNSGGTALEYVTVSGGIQAGVALYTTAGTYTWTVPTGVTAVVVTVQGGGGGSGGGSTYWQTAGSGGGAGGVASAYITGLTPGNTVSVVVGAGGAANSTGGTSSFGAYITCTGGAGGVTVNNSSNYSQIGGTGGTATISLGTNIVAITGGTGGYAYRYFYGENNQAIGSGSGGNPTGSTIPAYQYGSGGAATNGNNYYTVVGAYSGVGWGSGAGGGYLTGGGAGQAGAVLIEW